MGSNPAGGMDVCLLCVLCFISSLARIAGSNPPGGCISLEIVILCQVEVSASGLITDPYECDTSECVLEITIKRRAVWFTPYCVYL